MRRLCVVLAAAALAACAEKPQPASASPPRDAASESWYAPAAADLAALDRKADALFRAGKADDAAALVTSAQPAAARLLSARQPTLPAMQAVADLDDLYGRMLLANKRYGWARDFFRKNVVRWKTWQPRTPEVEQRLAAARSRVAECDRLLQ